MQSDDIQELARGNAFAPNISIGTSLNSTDRRGDANPSGARALDAPRPLGEGRHKGAQLMFSHMMVGSNDIARSKTFYDALFGAMGGMNAPVGDNAAASEMPSPGRKKVDVTIIE
jgi:hypothetical protein